MYKYQVLINYETFQICDVVGPVRGSVSDLSIAVRYLLPKLKIGERVLADKIYKGYVQFIIPFQGIYDNLPPEQKIYNDLHSKLHWERIEKVNNRLKNWKAITNIRRQGKKMLFHHICFLCICKLTNLDFVQHPIKKNN